MSFRSIAHLGGVKFRPLKDGLTEVAATITLPDGYVLTTADRLRFLQLGANVAVHELTVRSDELDTGTNTLTLNVGFESQNTGVQASNATAYAAAATIGQAGGTVRYEPTVAAPLANYTLTIAPAANANANTGVKRITVTAVIGPANVQSGLIGDGLGAAYDHGRPNPSV